MYSDLHENGFNNFDACRYYHQTHQKISPEIHHISQNSKTSQMLL